LRQKEYFLLQAFSQVLVLLIKNRHDDPIGFEAKKGPQDVDEFGEVEEETRFVGCQVS